MTEEMHGLSPLAQIREALTESQYQTVSEIINEMHPGEIARILESLPPSEREQVWAVVDKTFHGDVLSELGDDALENLVEEMSYEDLVQSATSMDDDDLVDLLQDLPAETSLRLLQSMDSAQRRHLTKMMEYDDETAGGMMNTDTITVRQNMSVNAVIRYLRRLEDLPDITSKLFVVDRHSKLEGEITLSRLLTADREMKVGDVMRDKYTCFNVNDSRLTVAQQFRENDLVSAAVVNDEGQLVGRITVDDVIDFIQEDAEKNLLNTAGLDEDVDTFAPIKQATVDRGLWLGINLVTALLAATVINLFADTIEKAVALAALSPLVASMGGIAGSQSLTIIIRGIALGQIEGANARLLLVRELTIGIINGLAWGLATAIIAFIWFGQVNLALIVISAIFINLCCAALSGVVIPLLLKKFNIDPALAGSVILTTVTDVVGFFVLLGLATVFLI
ncbi:MAG: magnesium transporter [Gammaproteobacteria bacterium]|nr:MAG: magnesium transporter [Gammaproteobacteria bacterium]